MPQNPFMLLSFVNTQLRDTYDSLDELAASFFVDKKDIIDKLRSINYEYDKKLNKFI